MDNGDYMGIKNEYVLDSGKLNDSLIVRREILYIGPKGREVERFFDLAGISYIFKSFSPLEEDSKEIWIYENILPLIPSIYPKIIAKSPSDFKNAQWIIYEDLGNVRHHFTKKIVMQVIDQMVTWHSLRIDQTINLPFTGAKPRIEEIHQNLKITLAERMAVFKQLGMDEQRIQIILERMEEVDYTRFPVLVHGDLHLGNYGLSNGKLVIMDWEHMHIASLYSDLYDLLDLSHPLFSKIVENDFRRDMLHHYYKRSDLKGLGLLFDEFIFEYYLYACVCSLWMILLIEKDLICKKEKWPKKALRNQRNVTLESFEQCSKELFELLRNR